MKIIYLLILLGLSPVFVLYIFACLISPIFRLGRCERGNEEEIFLVKDLIHSDYVFKAEQVQDIFPTTMKFVKVGWGDRKIFLELKSWGSLSVKDFLTAFFGMNESVLRVECLNELPQGNKTLKLYKWQTDKIKDHIKSSFYGKPIKKKDTYYQKGEYFQSSLNYNCITNCNNWINYGLFKSKVTNKVWCPLSFFI